MSLTLLKERIEAMPKYHQVEVLRLLSKHQTCVVNENNNGSFINLTEQPATVIEALQTYVDYVLEQQKQLSSVEHEKDLLEQTYFTTNGGGGGAKISM